MAAEAAISCVVQLLGTLIIQKVNFLGGVEGEVQRLTHELKRIQCFLRDATEKQAQSASIRNLISEIRQVAQDAEDAVEMFLLKVENASPWTSPNRMFYLDKIGQEIACIQTRLRDINDSRQRYGIQDGGEPPPPGLDLVERRRRLSPWEKDKGVVGLEKHVELLLGEVILQERKGLSVGTVVGMGGIGKSTVARAVYNHAAVVDRFECRAWVVVSSKFTPEEIFRVIMLQLRISLDHEKQQLLDSPKDKPLMIMMPPEINLQLYHGTIDRVRRDQILQEQVRGYLANKRYLIVLDDVWEDQHWEALAGAFPDGDRGSRLLLTSRKLVTTKQTRYVHQMTCLDPSKSWKLFLNNAFFHNNGSKCPQNLENIGRQILKKCDGLPLAISIIGGILAKQKQSESEWEKVLKGIKSHLGRRETNVSAILELSYQNLPPFLKPCFLSLALFREDATIRVEKLVHVWIAQGLVPQSVGSEGSMEDIARRYLDELINRNMVQVRDVTMDDRVKTCYMHDLIRNLSIAKAEEEINLEILRDDEASSSISESSRKPRHRAIYCSKEILTVCSTSTTQNDEHLRSLFIHGVGQYVYFSVSSSKWKRFQLLRLLDFEGCLLDELPEAIGELVGLKYLCLSDSGTNKFVGSLVKLKNLQILVIRGATLMEPNFIWKMENLRHFHASRIWWHKLLETTSLRNMQTLSYVVLVDTTVELIAQMTSLCKLCINVWRVSNISKLFAVLAELQNLVSLRLDGCDPEKMEGLKTLQHIGRLKLGGPMSRLSRLPAADYFPPNLSYLSLIGTHLDEDPMAVLEKLPKLVYLKLVNAYNGEEMKVSSGRFNRLEHLYLRACLRLRKISVREGGMPELKRFEIYDCPNLKSLNLPECLRSAASIHIR